MALKSDQRAVLERLRIRYQNESDMLILRYMHFDAIKAAAKEEAIKEAIAALEEVTI